MDNIGLQPPQPPIVTVEEPKIIKPAGGFGRTIKKHGLKFLMGGLLTLLLGAGVWLEVKVVQEKQQVESQAGSCDFAEPCMLCVANDCRDITSRFPQCCDNQNTCAVKEDCEGEPDDPLPPVCQSTSISSNTLSPEGSLTITSTAASADITGFSYAFYNLDNLYEPGNAKPICTGTGPASDICPNGGIHLVKGSTVSPTSTNTITVNYNDINVSDLSWGGQNPKKISVSAFFGNSAGWTHTDPNCVEQFEMTIPRPDYCVSASANKATMLPGETLTLSSVSKSNTPVNSFWYVTYNLDNLYEPGNAKPVCVGNETTGRPDWASNACPTSGYPLIFSDPSNSTGAGRSLRTNGSVQIPYANLFVNDKNWGNKQVKNLSFMAYFSLNGGQSSWPKDECKAFTAMGTVASPSPSPNPIISCNSNCDLYNGPANQCGQGLSCLSVGTGAPQSKCRNSQCRSETDCTCASTGNISCTSLTSSVANPVVGQSITGTCRGTFSGSVTSPVARFAVTLNGTVLGASESIPLNSAGTASYTTTVPQAGNYLVQCQICTDSTLSNCTTWGQAN